MKNKTILEILAIIIVIFTTAYLLTSFITMSFNPNNWGFEIRSTVTGITSIVSFFSIFGYSITKV